MVYKETYNTYDIIIGRNRDENNRLVKEMLEHPNKDNILWFHLRYIPSPHGFIIGENPNSYVIYKAASYVKKFSSEYNVMNTIVNYTNIKNISSTNVPGQVMIHGKTKTICI